MSPAPLRYGLVGAGMMGCEHLLNLRHLEGIEVTAIAEPHPTSREWARACVDESWEVAFFDDHRSMLDSVGDRVDAVVVATPNHTHLEILRDLLATPLAVMCEKPLATTVEDAREVVRLAEGREAITWVALEYRYMPTVSLFVERVGAGAAGTLRMISIREHRFPFLAKVDNWNRFSVNTGGTLVEKCCHFFDLMNLVVGSRPVRVFASGGQDVNHLDETYPRPDGTVGRPDILDNAFVVVDFANGARGMLDLCMFAEGAEHEQELLAVGDRGEVRTTVPGHLVRIGPREGSASEIDAPLDPEVRYEGFHHGSSFREHVEFALAVREGRPAAVTVDDGLWSVAVGAAAHLSIDEGRVVSLSELIPT